MSIEITKISPEPSRPSSAIGTIVRAVLTALGYNFNPPWPHHNAPILDAIWCAYRRIESFFDNTRPDIDGVNLVETRLTEDGQLAVDLAIQASDYDGDLLAYGANTGPHLIATGEGTYTYLADANFTGTVTLTFAAWDNFPSNHYHQGLPIWDYTGGHVTNVTINLVVLAQQPAPLLST